MNNEEKKAYEDNLKWQQEYEEGIEEGRLEVKMEIIKNMLKLNADLKMISTVTGTSIEEIQKLQ